MKCTCIFAPIGDYGIEGFECNGVYAYDELTADVVVKSWPGAAHKFRYKAAFVVFTDGGADHFYLSKTMFNKYFKKLKD